MTRNSGNSNSSMHLTSLQAVHQFQLQVFNSSCSPKPQGTPCYVHQQVSHCQLMQVFLLLPPSHLLPSMLPSDSICCSHMQPCCWCRAALRAVEVALDTEQGRAAAGSRSTPGQHFTNHITFKGSPLAARQQTGCKTSWLCLSEDHRCQGGQSQLPVVCSMTCVMLRQAALPHLLLLLLLLLLPATCGKHHHCLIMILCMLQGCTC